MQQRIFYFFTNWKFCAVHTLRYWFYQISIFHNSYSKMYVLVFFSDRVGVMSKYLQIQMHLKTIIAKSAPLISYNTRKAKTAKNAKSTPVLISLVLITAKSYRALLWKLLWDQTIFRELYHRNISAILSKIYIFRVILLGKVDFSCEQNNDHEQQM